ncbi:MAG TPA: glycoside hydrolase family 2 TIM barrel-domain containing protein, partial [Rectinemataceae bacterium]
VAEASAGIRADGGAALSFPELKGIELWDIGKGKLYDLKMELSDPGRGGGAAPDASSVEPLDALSMRIGFRQATFEPDGFVINGRKLRLRGLNRHQSWPYVGYAMGPGPQAADASILSKELGLDIVRTSHYPQSRHFLDACDELGLLVFTELPGWQHIGPEAWKLRALEDLESLITRDRNHPSVVLWGVRINESKDDDEFYSRTALLAARLDPTRQTGGVRYIKKSRLLEDVYTFNDFTHEGKARILAPVRSVTGLRQGVPFLVTEHNGHMYPTKSFDQEERRAEHARRHARILDLSRGREEGCGAIGWCAFDYNTHKDFGSGDRICYHGVSDMFRIPKWAAFAYSSQKDPERSVVLEPASLLAKGERSAARIIPFEVWTNCDAVDLYRAGSKVGRFYPDRKAYPHLPHPPVIIDDLIGERFEAEGWSEKDRKIFLRLASRAMSLGADNLGLADKLAFALLMARKRIGFAEIEALVTRYGMAWGSSDDELSFAGILDEKEVVRKTFRSDSSATALRVVPDSDRIGFEPGGEWNAVRVLVEAVDEIGNRVPYCFQPIRIEVSGPGRVLGPSCFSLISGAAAFWIATVGEPGEIRVVASAPGLAIPGRGSSFEAVAILRAEVLDA